MSLSIRPLTPSGFAGEVSGIDLTVPLSREQVAAIDAGMDQYGILVFHDQRFTDETQLAFSRQFGELEVSSGAEMSKPQERRLPQMEMADISNLDRDGQVRAASDRMRLTALGNRLWHSDASFRAVPANIRCCRRERYRAPAGTRNSPTCARPTTRWMTRRRRKSRT